MDPSTEEDKLTEAENLKDFFCDLMENSKQYVKYYFSDDIVLDWFGQTVKGQKNVSAFLKVNVTPVKHYFSRALPANSIGFRDTHVIKTPKYPRRILRSFMSPPRPCPNKSLPRTPKKEPGASGSVKKNQEKRDVENHRPVVDSAMKKLKFSHNVDASTEVLEMENDVPEVNVKYLTTEGYVEFRRPSIKKLQAETKWKRPAKLHIAYSYNKDVKDSTIYLIIYEGNMKCRRNLLKDFESGEPED
ncbi:uncharacterized protein LOC132705378 [Cylas formicarius]|uniref:uncharacterized protein LOC132705378 n=1 Tax=Cylas formicarius TaxID=197179 RepID=UPI002958336E|nr:uncharacterized protein LOC132705378 [Cylas formicarius]